MEDQNVVLEVQSASARRGSVVSEFSFGVILRRVHGTVFLLKFYFIASIFFFSDLLSRILYN